MRRVIASLLLFGCKSSTIEMTKELNDRKYQLEQSIKRSEISGKYAAKLSEERLKEMNDTLSAKVILDSSKAWFAEAVKMREEMKIIDRKLDSLSKLER